MDSQTIISPDADLLREIFTIFNTAYDNKDKDVHDAAKKALLKILEFTEKIKCI